ncbi:MAG: FG-GAP-like repeat-containing protein, partial [Microcystis sp. LE19-41.2A]|uniref:beta strand repeat-containing protein n=1 Tax=Microcystis sp. LE19-41.2A TaxID=3016427 RepID=UPI0022BEBC1A
MTSTLLPLLPAVYDILFDFAQSDGFWANLETAFGTNYDVVKATQLRQQWQSRDFSQLPPITVKNLGNSGIFGAYSSSINKIYISQALIDSGDATTLKAVLLEEIGHFIDAQINSSDTPGDEGQLFSALVRGESLTEAEIAAIREENDAATITVDGQAISVEMAFSAATNFTVGSGPRSVTVGDFNGDGKSDLAVANRGGNNVSVLLGTGTGSFGTATNFSVGAGPLSVTVGDFNRDGKSDLAVANRFTNNVSVLLNTTPKITIAPGTNPVEGGTVGNFIITLDTPAPTGGIVVNFNTTGTTATILADYSLTAGTNITAVTANTFTIAAGATTATLNVVAVSDAVSDPNETVKVNLTSGGDYILGANSSASFNSAINFSVGSNPLSVTVGDFNGDGKLDLATANYNGNNVSVLLGTGTGSFGTPTNFSVGNRPRSVTVGDFNGDGKSDLAVANVNSNNVSVLLNADPTATVTITDPSISLTINDVTVTEGNSGTTNAVFTVSLSSAASTVVSVDYATANGTATAGTDYTAIPTTTLTFNPGETSKTITVPVNGDNQVELNETFFLNLSNLQTNGSNVTLADNQGQGTINNDDSASIAISDVTITEGNSGTTNAVFTVTLSNAVDTAVTVNYATANGTATTTDNDYIGIATTPLTFNAGETSKTITVAVNGDNQVESNETFFVNLSNLQANGRNVTITDNQGQGTITDDDVILPSITLAVSPSSVTEDGTTNLVYTFTRSGVTSNALTVNYTLGGTATLNTDYTRTGTTNTVTFVAGSSTATVTVDPTADTTVESDETVVLTLASGTGYTIGTSTPVTGTITNDDFPQLSINNITVVEGLDNNAILTVTVDNPNPQPITFNYTTAPINATANVDYTSKTGTITIAPNTSTATISIP